MPIYNEGSSRAPKPGEYSELVQGVHLRVIFAEQERPEVLGQLRSLLLCAYREQFNPAAIRD